MEKTFIPLRLWANKTFALFVLIFILLIFLRFYDIDTRSSFGFDQVNNAWAAKKIIVNHEFPLLGFQAKVNSGIYIGPFYYYLIAIVYFLTDLNPIASGIMAGVTSIFTFLTLFYITGKIFHVNAAIIAVFLNTVSFFAINFDRVQGPVNFIPLISLIIFFALYKIVTGSPKFILLLSFAFGFSLHVHITSIFFPIIILLSLPFFPRTKDMLRFTFLSIPIFLFFLFPSVLAFLQNQRYASDAISYGNTYFHGFHLKRVMQLTNDAFIQFESYFNYSDIIKYLKFILLPSFIFLYLYKNTSRGKLLFCYLVLLWFVIPWLVLSTYSGEISDYYYSSNKYVALLIIAYLVSKAFQIRNTLTKLTIIILLFSYVVFNLQSFFSSTSVDNLKDAREFVEKEIEEGRKVGFQEGVPESYLYYYFMRKRGEEVY
ncbi:MAG: hypothetical protein HYT07_02160 [Candidatus Levybacteria bacterium]|nr:hypothetical protein [Candidatus Levybacteria bacterium]